MSLTVLQDVTSETVDAKHIQKRVDDWEERLKNLYEKISDWLPNGWQALNGNPVRMNETLMRKFGIEAKQIPTLTLLHQSGDSVKLEPRGLWIIGANGRLDLKHAGQHYFIVDFAKNFEQPDWHVVRAENRFEREKLSQEWLTQILR